MTREECESRIREKLQEIRDIYKEYHPEGEYIDVSFFRDGFYAYNMWRSDGCNDQGHPLEIKSKDEGKEE